MLRLYTKHRLFSGISYAVAKTFWSTCHINAEGGKEHAENGRMSFWQTHIESTCDWLWNTNLAQTCKSRTESADRLRTPENHGNTICMEIDIPVSLPSLHIDGLGLISAMMVSKPTSSTRYQELKKTPSSKNYEFGLVSSRQRVKDVCKHCMRGKMFSVW